ncbi:MAG: group III truncated hemoglobin [Planctomycetes bacterium]|nr:group III truncated hemoglobin [Planctomycetota bacterium]
MITPRPIESRADLRTMIDAFYERLLGDERIAGLFAGLDLAVHKPVLVDFWAMILLGEDCYRSNTFQKHLHLALERRHFGIWLGHFEATLDLLFVGERAETAKMRARSIAAIFESKLVSLGRIA